MIKKILPSMFIHMFIVWAAINLDWVLPYMYRVHLYGNYLWKMDHTATTPWEYFLLLDYYPRNVYHLIAKVCLFIPMVELCYWYLFRRNLLGKAITAAIAIGVLITITDFLPFNKETVIMFNNDPFGSTRLSLTYAGYAMVYGLVRSYLHERPRRRAIQLQRSENELNALKAQLNPHFFFNSLNYLYGTALNEKAAKTADAINTLSEMMRYTISGMRESFVPIADDLEFIKNYLALQRVRIPQKESIIIKTSVNADEGNQKIAPLLLLPFIENAFKYGISIDHPCYINLNIRVNGGKLDMAVTNRIINEHSEVKGNNSGIINTRRRLELLYEDKYFLHCDDSGEEYKVSLSIQLV